MNSCCRSLYGHHRLLFATLVFLKMKEKTDSKVLSDEELRLLLTGGRVEERCVSQELFWEHGLTIYFFCWMSFDKHVFHYANYFLGTWFNNLFFCWMSFDKHVFHYANYKCTLDASLARHLDHLYSKQHVRVIRFSIVYYIQVYQTSF